MTGNILQTYCEGEGKHDLWDTGYSPWGIWRGIRTEYMFVWGHHALPKACTLYNVFDDLLMSKDRRKQWIIFAVSSHRISNASINLNAGRTETVNILHMLQKHQQ